MITVRSGKGEPASHENIRVAEQKAKRNSLLANSDIYLIEDFPTTKKTEWKAYRKALRDMDFSDLDNLIWPTKPE